MAKLIYSAIASLDGYVEDEDGKFDWAEPDEEVHAFVNDLERPVGTYLYGRRLYETMAGWETDPGLAGHSPVMRDFAAIWQAAEKIVYSRTLKAVSTTRTRIEREFDPDAVRQEKRGGRPRPPGGRCRSRRRGVPGRARRRAPSLPHARPGGRRQARSPAGRQPEARVAGRAPFRQRHGLPPLSHRRRRGCRGLTLRHERKEDEIATARCGVVLGPGLLCMWVVREKLWQ